MSEQEKSLLDEQAALIRAVYRALPEEEVPAELDRRILESAAAAIKPNRESNARRWLQWSAPLASAAVVLLVVAVVMQPQSQHEMVPAPVAANDYQPVAPPPAAEAPAVPRLPVEKPDLSATPEELAELRTQSSRPRALDRAASAPKPAIAPPPVAAEMMKRKESVSEASQPSQAIAAEPEQDRLSVAQAPETTGASGAVAASSSADNRPDISKRSSFMRVAPAAAQLAAKSVSAPPDVLNISPELRARLEKFSSTRLKSGASVDEAALAQLRRDYPGVDIDAALRALEQLRVEGAE